MPGWQAKGLILAEFGAARRVLLLCGKCLWYPWYTRLISKFDPILEKLTPMTILAVAALLAIAFHLLGKLFVSFTELLAGIEEARAMALAYQNLAKLSVRELAARGLKRADIPRAVLAAFNGA